MFASFFAPHLCYTTESDKHSRKSVGTHETLVITGKYGIWSACLNRRLTSKSTLNRMLVIPHCYYCHMANSPASEEAQSGSEVQPAPGAEKKLERLKLLLREMFQLDRGDLDFGLYRIMNLKSEEIVKFLENDLLPQVKESLDLTHDEARVELQAKRKKLIDAARMLNRTRPEDEDKVKEVDRELKEVARDEQTESDVYNHLANFFDRYYSEGDFIAQRRYSSGGQSSYLIPYDGEEVKLHWANADQYYVKTTENYASYAFTVGQGRNVRFEIAAADNEKDNIKESNGRQRRFVLARGEDNVVSSETNLIVRFDHRPLTEGEKKLWPGNGSTQQPRINEETVKRVLSKVSLDWSSALEKLAPTNSNGERTLLAKHVERYTAKNSFDYFIHKDLGNFLRRELEMYLNTDVMNLEELDLTGSTAVYRAIARARAIRQIGGKIIDFLAQLEDFQKQLWLKKKFVLETNWCVTLDRIPEEMYPEITKNEAQCQEWIDLYAVDEINGDLANGNTSWTVPPSVDFLKSNPFLMLDTKHFDQDFIDKLLGSLSGTSSLDEQMNGFLIHGENFQALNLLKQRYNQKVKSIYIDPPYNTDASAILYKNGYKNSSWMSLMHDRLSLSSQLLHDSGIVCMAIDDTEVSALRSLTTSIFPVELGIVSVCSNPRGRKTKGRFAPAHEYALFYSKLENTVPGALPKSDRQIQSYPEADETGRFIWMNMVRSGTNDKREDRPKLFFPIFVNTEGRIRIPELEWNETQREWIVLEEKNKNEIEIYPLRKVGNELYEGNWHRGHERINANLSEYRAKRSPSDKFIVQFKARMDEDSPPNTWWGEGKYDSSNGSKRLKAMFGNKIFDFPKSVDLTKDCILTSINENNEAEVLDFFAGSGTTGQAIININRDKDVGMRYILIEMGEHFNTVILPRMKKAVFSFDWKDGKPVNRDGVSHLIKYITLESYEDTMDSLEVAERTEAQDKLLENNPELAEDYYLRYSLGAETSKSASLLGKDFADPFAYKLSVFRDGAKQEVSVDLPETFNYLIGLTVESRRKIDGLLTYVGTDAEAKRCLIIWRNLNETDYFTLDAWFEKNRNKLIDEVDTIYVNGDHTLNAMKQDGDRWTAKIIEPIFKELMFQE